MMINLRKFSVLFLLILIILPLINALTITDTIFFSSVSNSTIHVDSITLDNVTVTNQATEFYNLTSVGSNLTNINATYNASADFFGLAVGLVVYNVNRNSYLFTSSTANQDYTALFGPGEVIRILTESEATVQSNCDNMVDGLLLFGAFIGIIVLAIIGKVMIGLFRPQQANPINQKLISIVVSLAILSLVVVLGIITIPVICSL